MKCYSLLLLFVFLFLKVSSQSCESCNEALRKDLYYQSNNLYLKSRYFEDISDSEYNEYKKNLSSRAKIPIPELKVIVEGSFNYDDFKKRMRDYNSKIESELTVIKADEYMVIRTDPTAYQYWAKCMENCTGKFGVYLINNQDAEDFGVFKIRYFGSPGDPEEIYCKIEIKSEDTTYTKPIILAKNGIVSMTYNRKFVNNKSTTIVSLNASKIANGPQLYGDNFKTIYLKPAAIKILSCDYTYAIKVTKVEIGEEVVNCTNPIPPDPDAGRRGRAIAPNRVYRYLYSNNNTRSSFFSPLSSNPSCRDREKHLSNDGKWWGYFAILNIIPSQGFKFNSKINLKTNLVLTGRMAQWNWGQRDLDRVVIDKPELKQIKIWLHEDVTAHLEMYSEKDSIINETCFASVNDIGIISFSIPDNRLTNYNISLRLSTGDIININPQNVNDVAYLNHKDGITTFTIKKQFH